MPISSDELKNIMAELCSIEPSEIKDDTLLVADLQMDSIKVVELLAILAEDYDIHATEEDAVNFNSFKDLFEFSQKAGSGS